MPLSDSLGRPLRDLRISVTDRCNFRCRYCMPREHFGSEHQFLGKEEILSYEEISKLAKSMIPLGLKKLRITGGEPLIRRDIGHLVSMLRRLGDDLDLAMTTNGVLLKNNAEALKQAGLNRVTVSLDALDRVLFQKMGDTKHEPTEVIEGIDEALRVGLEVKVNMVVQRSLNETQIIPIAGMCFERSITPRFIEFMDVGATNKWNLESVVSGQEIREIISKEYGGLRAVIPNHPSDVARRWTTPEGYEFGLIQSVTEPFCGDCSRARISANGSLYTCLFASQGHDLRALLRFDANHDELQSAIQSIWMDRKDRYSEQRTNQVEVRSKVEMSFIGG